ncbi:MAG TPA: AtpZ/AtpI family protein [Candidatus Saccharimonadia bacterium]
MGERNREQSVSRLLWSMADTTWRMFTPPTITVAGGLWADLHWGTKPWLTLLAAAVGLSISIWLVKRQLKGSE